LIPSTSPSIDPTLAAVSSNRNVQLSAGVIAGITVGVFAFVVAVVAVFYFSSTAVLSLESATEMSTMKNPIGEDSELL
jgi:hypothetical protein